MDIELTGIDVEDTKDPMSVTRRVASKESDEAVLARFGKRQQFHVRILLEDGYELHSGTRWLTLEIIERVWTVAGNWSYVHFDDHLGSQYIVSILSFLYVG